MSDNEMLLPVHAFDTHSGEWHHVTPDSKSTSRDTLTIATFNIWFVDYYTRERYQAIMNILEAHLPDFIALQEVTEESLAFFLSQKWIQKYYQVSDIDGTSFSYRHGYGVVIFSRLPVHKFRLIALPSLMGRRLLIGEVRINGTILHVGTVHLESLKVSAPIREYQLKMLFEQLQKMTHVIVVGDFNFCATWENENKFVDREYTDIWSKLRPDEAGYTEDTAINTMRLQIKGQEKQVRFDRILLKSPTWNPTFIGLLGTQAISPQLPDVFPSDHFGLLSRIHMD